MDLMSRINKMVTFVPNTSGSSFFVREHNAEVREFFELRIGVILKIDMTFLIVGERI